MVEEKFIVLRYMQTETTLSAVEQSFIIAVDCTSSLWEKWYFDFAVVSDATEVLRSRLNCYLHNFLST